MIKIFIDFDGTITKEDIGDAVFITFGGKLCKDFINEYRAGKISAVECFRREARACEGTDSNLLNDFLESQKIDPSFIDFLEMCRRRELESYILSDGMDYYIEKILRKNGISNITVYTNHLDLINLDSTSMVMFDLSFPYTDEMCDRCACCKRNHILTLSGDDDIIVYIGEGFSDRCPVHYADVVFAKDELLKYCKGENISYFEYGTFADIIKRFNGMLKKNRLKKDFGFKKRRQAQLAARNVFIGG